MIIVYGASGFTGELVCAALAERGLPFAIAGRDRARLSRCADNLQPRPELRLAPVHDAAALRAAFADARVVINCAGPFAVLGEPVLRAAIDAGTHYVDITSEQLWMRQMYERYESPARRAGVVVVNGLAFMSAIGDWAATLAAQTLAAEQEAERDDDLADDALPDPVASGDAGTDDTFDEIVVGYAVAIPQTSRGTQLSVLDSLARSGCVWRIDRWEDSPPAAERRLLAFPDPFGEREVLSFPGGDVVTIPRHIDARFVQTYVSVIGDSAATRLISRAANLLSPALPTLLSSPLGALVKAQIGVREFSPAARRAAQFAVVASATRRFRDARAIVTGFDIYETSAQIAAGGAQALLEGRFEGGVRSPAEVLDPSAQLDALELDVQLEC